MRLLFFLLSWSCLAQQGHLHTIAFYNVENLFDAQDDAQTFDDDYTPKGRKAWQSTHVAAKIHQLATVIIQIGQAQTQQPPLIIGLAEIENKNMLNRLTTHSAMVPFQYGIAHFESPDYRGIDVGLLYRKNLFQFHRAKAYAVELTDPDTGYKKTTRDILLVEGFLGEKRIHLLVNHWPSRRGGKRKSAQHRFAAAHVHRKITDSILRKHPQARIISMGDYNDNPIDKSVAVLTKSGLNNKSKNLFQKGSGSLAYRDQWHLFDQIFFSENWTPDSNLFFYDTRVFAPLFLRNPKGRYRGYPWRTEINGSGLNGYSDHFPVYALIGQRMN